MAHSTSKTQDQILPTSAKSWVTLVVNQGIVDEETVRVAFTRGQADAARDLLIREVVSDEVRGLYMTSWTNQHCEDVYKELGAGDRDADVYQIEVEIPKDNLPYRGMALRLAFALYEVMLWALNDAGVENIHEPNRPKAGAYALALNALAEAYEEFKGVGLRLVRDGS